jgi:hypothetical protein
MFVPVEFSECYVHATSKAVTSYVRTVILSHFGMVARLEKNYVA